MEEMEKEKEKPDRLPSPAEWEQRESDRKALAEELEMIRGEVRGQHQTTIDALAKVRAGVEAERRRWAGSGIGAPLSASVASAPPPTYSAVPREEIRAGIDNAIARGEREGRLYIKGEWYGWQKLT